MSTVTAEPPRAGTGVRVAAAPPVVAAEGLRYGYRWPTPVIRDLDLDLSGGTMAALTGPSGTGKSTLLYLLSGLLTPWSGQVRLDGVDQQSLLDRARARFRAENFGFVFQDVVLDLRRPIIESVLEPCLYAGRSRSELAPRAHALLDQLGVRLKASSLPGEISGGQAQRVGVCRALLLSPRVVFADEPTGNLDNASAAAVLDALHAASRRGAVVVVATHDDRVVERCDRQVVLR